MAWRSASTSRSRPTSDVALVPLAIARNPSRRRRRGATTRFSRGAAPPVATCRPAPLIQVAVQQIHEQAVVPLAVEAAFELAQHTDRLEADALVGADCFGVVRRGVDRQPVVPAIVHEVTNDGAHGVGADALAVP